MDKSLKYIAHMGIYYCFRIQETGIYWRSYQGFFFLLLFLYPTFFYISLFFAFDILQCECIYFICKIIILLRPVVVSI